MFFTPKKMNVSFPTCPEKVSIFEFLAAVNFSFYNVFCDCQEKQGQKVWGRYETQVCIVKCWLFVFLKHVPLSRHEFIDIVSSHFKFRLFMIVCLSAYATVKHLFYPCSISEFLFPFWTKFPCCWNKLKHILLK